MGGIVLDPVWAPARTASEATGKKRRGTAVHAPRSRAPVSHVTVSRRDRRAPRGDRSGAIRSRTVRYPDRSMPAAPSERFRMGDRDRQRAQIRRRRAVLVAVVVLVVVLLVVVAVARLGGDGGDGAVASPVTSGSLALGNRPPDRVIATAGPVQIKLPVGREFVRATLFRSINDPSGVATKPDKSWQHTTESNDDEAGPSTAGIDFAAPPDTIVYSPVDGTVVGVTDYVVAGKDAGYQVEVSPKAASDLIVRIRHIEAVPAGRQATPVCGQAAVEEPKVGQVLVAGVTCIGQVRSVAKSEIVDVARPRISKYVSDGGNHVHVEVVRIGA